MHDKQSQTIHTAAVNLQFEFQVCLLADRVSSLSHRNVLALPKMLSFRELFPPVLTWTYDFGRRRETSCQIVLLKYHVVRKLFCRWAHTRPNALPGPRS